MTRTSTHVSARPTGTAILFLATLTTGLSAGFFYAWQVSSIPGLRLLEDVAYIEAMNAINSIIRNAGFGIPFFGSPILILLALILRLKHWRTAGFALLFLSLALYLIGLMGITVTVHVPMNIDLLSHADLTTIDTQLVRSQYETRWNDWHLVRTVAAVGSFAAILGVVYIENSAVGRRATLTA